MVIRTGMMLIIYKYSNYKRYSHSSNEHFHSEDSNDSNDSHVNSNINDGNASNGCMQW